MQKTLFISALLISSFLNAQQASTSIGNEMVLTPEGLRKKADVHHVESSCYLSVENGHIVKRNNKTKNLVIDYGEVSKNTSSMQQNRAAGQQSTQAVDSTFGDGWITYAYWSNTSSKPISYLSTNWIVPNDPVTDNGQTVFLFNGIDPANPSDAILQPVLQWGPSAAGGGSYWAVTNWYVPASGVAFWGDSLVVVTPGTNLQGVMELTSQSSSGFSYSSYFVGYPNCTIQVNNVTELKWANQTMEVYGATGYLDYPPDTSVSMSAISMLTGTVNPTNPVVIWHPQNVVTDVGQHCIVTSNSTTNGNVDLYFHMPLHINTAGINTITDEAAFRIYPNPACNAITIEKQNATSLNNTLSIKNVQGREVLRQRLNFASDQSSIDVSALSNGIYFLSLLNEEGSYMQKIVIQR